ncbi:multidrug resistance protein MDR [Apiospora arundinis]
MFQQRQQSSLPPCSIEVEDVWGPQVHGCGTDFDLTLLFQEVVLFISPLAVALCLCCLRIWQLARADVVVASSALRWIKRGFYGLFILLHAAVLAVQAAPGAQLTRATLASSAVALAGSLVLILTSHLEHTRSVRASTVLVLYFGYSLAADALRTRTLWSMPPANAPVAAAQTAVCACKLLLFLVERQDKLVRKGTRTPTADEKADILSRIFLWWVIPLFKVGKATPTLTAESLPNIEFGLTVAGRRPSNSKGFVPSPDSGELYKSSIFRHILSATQAFYRQCTARSITAVRADLVSLIHDHSLRLSTSSSAQDSASTLMSADVERFVTGTRNMHECWACVLELALSLYVLETQIGVATAAAGGLSVTFIGLTSLIAGAAGRRQNAWLKGMETRITATTQALKSMKGIKMTGIAAFIRRDLIALRKDEIRKMRGFRQILMLVLWAMWIPVIMAPIVAFTVYNFAVAPRTGNVLSPAMVYQCLTILNIFGNNVATLLDSSVNLVTAGASLLRIQEFIMDENTRSDKRVILHPPSDDADDDNVPLLPASPPARSNAAIRMQRLRRTFSQKGQASATTTTLRLTRACAGWSADGPLVVNGANLEVSSPSIVAVVGPTGSGKTTLLQMLLGETQQMQGEVGISTRHIGYCSQTPWLTHATIRENIVGSSDNDFDAAWYEAVIQATALQKDLRLMAQRDETVVGNDGSGLSGGQKKRIALARALYARAPVLILDDPFNGLDGRTESRVLEALLGTRGCCVNIQFLLFGRQVQPNKLD